MSCRQTTRENNYIKEDNKSFENVAKFRYLAVGVINQNCIYESKRSRKKVWNACYDAVQNLLSSRLLSKNVKINKYETTILLGVFMAVKLAILR
jgi:hypothetical protein